MPQIPQELVRTPYTHESMHYILCSMQILRAHADLGHVLYELEARSTQYFALLFHGENASSHDVRHSFDADSHILD